MSEADLRSYHDRKRPMVLWSLVVATVAGSGLALHAPLASVALVLGVGCGLVNALLTMRSNERLADHKNPGLFVLSSTLRIAVFGIVPVVFAQHGQALAALAAYFIGFFSPFALYTILVARTVRTG